MTNEEAIKELSEWLDACCGEEEIEQTREALRMAIEALKAQIDKDIDVPNNNDAQKVQDKLFDVLKGFVSDLPCDESPDDDWCAEHCEYTEPQNECWIRWAKGVMGLPLEDDKQ